MADERRDWEYAGGPDVPVTSEPRDEDAAGAPARPRPRGDHSRPGTERRPVEAAEPRLSDEANARLTEEVREVVGDDTVEVPRDRPDPARGPSSRPGIVAYLGTHRPIVLGTLAGALVLGAIVALVSGSWWVLLAALAVHAVATMVVVAVTLRMTTTAEHPSPELAAAMSDQGIRNPDEHFTDLVEGFSPEGRAGKRTPSHDEAE